MSIMCSPLITGNPLTPRADISYQNEATIVKPKSVNEIVVSKSKINRNEVIIEDWTLDDEDDVCAVKIVSSVEPNAVSTARPLASKIAQSTSVIRPNHPDLEHFSKGKVENVFKKAKWGNPKILLQDHAVVDSGCFSHMTGNKAYLSDYEDLNGGFMAFGKSDPKEGKLRKNSVLFTESECLILSPSFKLLDES
ncbi:hypothetical protein Tco_0513849 [Tanacetum coccineum]